MPQLRNFLAAIAALHLSAMALPAANLLIRNVTVIDVNTGVELPRRSILIRGDKITAVGSDIPHAAGTEVVDGSGRFAIPGLWDMHVHLWHNEHLFPMYLAYGITGLRDMGSDLGRVNQWRREITAGRLLGPRIETCGSAVDGFPSTDPKLPVVVVRTAAEARQTYDRLDSQNVDFIEVLATLPREAYFALIERARKYYSPVAGYIPGSVSVMEAIDARQKSIEHMSGILMACSSDEARLSKQHAFAIERKDWAAAAELESRAMASYSARKAEELFERMARFETRQVPTLVMLRRGAYVDTEKLATDPHLSYIPPSIRKSWGDIEADRKKLPQDSLDFMRVEYEKLAGTLRTMRRAGVQVMAGTDTGNAYTFPGIDLHRELELLVQAGFTPLEALRSATSEPAQFLGTKDLGSIAPGKLADLVLLDANPLKDIRNTQKIAGVFVGGQYLSRAKLTGMLAGLKVHK
jgi:imidazolonepropionase-like amidohydrolase